MTTTITGRSMKWCRTMCGRQTLWVDQLCGHCVTHLSWFANNTGLAKANPKECRLFGIDDELSGFMQVVYDNWAEAGFPGRVLLYGEGLPDEVRQRMQGGDHV